MTLTMPSGLHPELEDALQTAYGLREAIVVDAVDQEDQIVRDLGAAAAFYLETTLKARDVVGISSWSAALLAMVEAMHPSPRAAGAHVVQILGGIGSPSAELHATQLTRRLANLLGGVATLLPAPGAVGSAEARRVMLKDRYVQEAMALFKSITVALVGIGAVTPSKMLAASGNVFSARELKSLSERGAVGDICLRFFDAQRRAGRHAAGRTRHRHRAADLQRVDRVVGIAGGRRKFAAIRGALRGRRINVLITDRTHCGAPRQECGGGDATGARGRRGSERAGECARVTLRQREARSARCSGLRFRSPLIAMLRPWTMRPLEGADDGGVRRRRFRRHGVAAARARGGADRHRRVGVVTAAGPRREARFLKGTGIVAAVDRQSRVGVLRVQHDRAPARQRSRSRSGR